MDVPRGLAGDRWVLGRAVFDPGQRAGHYESFYQRANHPRRPLRVLAALQRLRAAGGRPETSPGPWRTGVTNRA